VQARSALIPVKLLHTVVWAFFAGCVIALPVAALAARLRLAAWLGVAVLFEVAVLVANRMRCPLTAVAARCTGDRCGPARP